MALDSRPGAATAITPDGSTIVGYINDLGDTRAFRFRDSTGLVLLENATYDASVYGGPGSAKFENVLDVSADGSIIVGSGAAFSPTLNGAMIWQEGLGTRYLLELLTADLGVDLMGWRLDFASGISNNGTRIVGRGKNPNGQTEAWIVSLVGDLDAPPVTGPNPVPEPASVVLFSPGFAGLILIHRKRAYLKH